MSTTLNVFVALAMVIGTVVLFTGGSLAPRAAVPTLASPADIPTLAPTVGAPLATPVPTDTPVTVSTPAATPTASP